MDNALQNQQLDQLGSGFSRLDIASDGADARDMVFRLRTGSAILRAFPWWTNVILDDGCLEDRLPLDDPMRRLGKQLDDFMKAVYSSKQQNLADVRSALMMQGSVGDFPRFRTVTGYACSILSVLRAYDMASLLADTGTIKQSVHVHPKTTLPAIKGLTTHWRKLDNWIDVLRRSKECVDAVNSLPEYYDPAHTGDTLSKLLDFLQSTNLKSKGIQIAENFACAALYLIVVMNTTKVDGLLEIPDDTLKMLRQTGHNYDDGSINSRTAQETLSRRSAKNVFLLAAMASPLYLLIPSILASSMFSKETAVMMAKALGNDLPPTLQSVVPGIWKAVFQIACGIATPIAAVRNLLRAVNWELLDTSQGAAEAGWYHEHGLDRELSNFAACEVRERIVDQDSNTSNTGSEHKNGNTDTPCQHSGSVEDAPAVNDTMMVSSLAGTELGKNSEDKGGDLDGPTPTGANGTACTESGTTCKSDRIKDIEEARVHDCMGEAVDQLAPANKSSKDKMNENENKNKNSSSKRVTSDVVQAPSVVENVVGMHRKRLVEHTSQDISFVLEEVDIESIETDREIPNLDCSLNFELEGIELPPNIKPFRVYSIGSSYYTPLDVKSTNRDMTILLYRRIIAAGQTYDWKTGLPLFLCGKSLSRIQCLLKTRFNELETKKRMESYYLTPILVLSDGDVTYDIAFDENTLEDVQDIDMVCIVHNQECMPYPITLMHEALSRNCSVTVEGVKANDGYIRSGTLRQIIACADNGKPVCSLYLRQPMSTVWSHFATDMLAWKSTKDMSYCKQNQVPLGDIRWAHVATQHSYTFWHIEPNGYSTYFSCIRGVVLLLIQVDTGREEHHSGHRDTSIARYTTKLEAYEHVEAVCLWPGETVYVQPNTTYCLNFLQDTICHGGYFYHHSTMAATLVGYTHMLLAGESASSSPRSIGWDQLHRMVMFYHNVFVCGNKPTPDNFAMHVPQIKLMDDFVNMVSLCCLVMWCNAFSPDTYQRAGDIDLNIQERFGVTRMDAVSRYKCAYMKKVAKTLLIWLLRNFNTRIIMSDDIESTRSKIFVPFVGTLVQRIAVYYFVSKEAGLVPRIQPADREELISHLLDPFHDYDDLRQWIDEHDGDTGDSLLYKICGSILIEPVHRPPPTRPFECSQHTPMDTLYFVGRDNNWSLPAPSCKKRLKRFDTDDISSMPVDRHTDEDDSDPESDIPMPESEE